MYLHMRSTASDQLDFRIQNAHFFLLPIEWPILLTRLPHDAIICQINYFLYYLHTDGNHAKTRVRMQDYEDLIYLIKFLDMPCTSTEGTALHPHFLAPSKSSMLGA